MKRLKHSKLISLIIIIVLTLGLFLVIASGSFTSTSSDKQVSVGIVGTTDEPIWRQVNRNLKPEHIHVNVKVFTDGNAANQSTANGQLDLNSFQHYAFLRQENHQQHFNLKPIGQTYIMPLNVYSKKIKSLKQIKSGDKIAIPNNPTNAGRALKVLQKAKLIKTNPSKGYLPTPHDIISNPHHIKIVEVDPASIIKLLPNFAAGITNSNFVQANHLNPQKAAIFKISPNVHNPYNKPWINIIATKNSKKHNRTLKKVVKAYHSKSVARVIKKKYKGICYPAF